MIENPALSLKRRKDMSKLLSYRPPRIAIALLAISTGFWYFSPSHTILYMPYKLVASVCIIVGFTGMVLAWLQFKKSDTAVCPTAKTLRIITNGLYRYTRNPMYLGMLLMLLGTSFIMGTIPSMLAPVVFFLTIDKTFIPYEEDKLQAAFGDSYNEYIAATRRWL
jgi:protein-S-isoprenylcysteine O-methyltransferase Ste14